MLNNDPNELWVVDDILVTGTPLAAPTVTTTAPATAITSTGATVAGNISSLGNPTASSSYGFVYSSSASTAAALVLAGAGVSSAEVGTTGAALGSYSTALAGLTASTVYYYRAYVTNAAGTGYGTVETFTTAATPSTPSLTTTPTALSGFTYSTSGGGPSASQSYTLNGTNLTAGNLTVTGSANYEVSVDNITFGGTATVANAAGGTLAATPVYVRLKAGLPAGPYNGETIANTGGGAPAANVTVSGSVTTPTVTVSVTSLAAFSAQVPTPSAPQNFTVGGTNLVADIIVTPPSGYEMAIGAASVTYFTTPQTITQTAGTVATTTIRVRLIGATAGTYGTPAVPFTVTNASTGATQQDVAVNGVVTPMQALTVTPNVLSGFSTTQGTPSAAQSYALAGTDLTSGVTVTAPTGYQVSQTSATAGFAATQAVTQAAATAGTTLYVRLTGATAGTFGTPGTPVNITNTATGAATKTVALDGTTTAVPFLTVTPTPSPLNAFNTLPGTPSAAQSFTLSGTALTNDVVVTAPGEYEVSQTSATVGFAAFQTVTQAAATAGTTLFVRLTGATAGTFGTTATPLQVTITSTGAVSRTVDVKGTVVGEPAAAPAPTVVAGSPTAATVPLTLGAGAGTNLLVVVRPSANPATAPLDGTPYPASTVYGSGTALGGGFVVFAAPNATSVTVTGLTPSTSYAADVYTYNVGTVAGFENYEPTGGTTAFTTLAPPPTVAGALFLEEDFDYPAGTLLSAQGWVVTSTSSPALATTAGNLISSTYPQGAALNATPVGASSRASLGTSGEDLYKNGVRPSSTVVYGAAIISVSAVQTNGDYFAALAPSSASYRNRVYLKKSGTGMVFGLSLANEPETYSTTVFSLNTSYVVVLKSENSAATGNFDVVKLFVMPVGTDIRLEPVTPLLSLTATATGNLSLPLNAFVLRQGSASAAPTLTVDGIRLATGWGAAVGRPAFTTAAATVAAGNYYDLTVDNADVLTTSGTINVESSLGLTSGIVKVASPSSLLLYQAATVGGGSASSFVDGPLARATGSGAATTMFPIGKGTAYRPLTLTATAQASASTYTAEQFEPNASRVLAPGNGLGSAPLQRVSSKRYFRVISSNTTAGNFTGTITLAFDSDDYVNTPASPDLVVAKRDATGPNPNQWTNIDRSASTGLPSGPGGTPVTGTLTSALFSDFSDFALGATNDLSTVNTFNAVNPLPVELTAFAAQRQANNSVSLQWNTASEKNSARFEVQRSLNGRNFATVVTVAAQGSSARATAYTAADLSAPAAALYYRLRQVDRDGTASFSPAVSVNSAGLAARVQLYPNPAQARIGFFTEAPTPYRVLNQLGQALLQGTTDAGPATVPVATLPVGLYLLELTTPAGRVVQRFERE